MKKTIKFPVAFNNKTDELVNISDVDGINKQNLICKDCKENFISVVNHQTPHFRHKNTNCQGNSETYIHWVCKEIFKTISQIELPELLIINLPEKHRQKFQKNKGNIIEKNVPVTLRTEFRKILKEELAESRKYVIKNIKIEKLHKTIFGDVIIDITAYSENEIIFIEPFLTNAINEDKIKKLNEIGISTISIDLNPFINQYNLNFKIETLKKYLISKLCKYWSYLKDSTYKDFIEKYEEYMISQVEIHIKEINLHKSKISKIEKLELKRSETLEDIMILRDEYSDIEKQILDLKNEIDYPY